MSGRLPSPVCERTKKQNRREWYVSPCSIQPRSCLPCQSPRYSSVLCFRFPPSSRRKRLPGTCKTRSVRNAYTLRLFAKSAAKTKKIAPIRLWVFGVSTNIGVKMVLRLETDAFSMVKRVRKTANEHPPPPSCNTHLLVSAKRLKFKPRSAMKSLWLASPSAETPSTTQSSSSYSLLRSRNLYVVQSLERAVVSKRKRCVRSTQQ